MGIISYFWEEIKIGYKEVFVLISIALIASLQTRSCEVCTNSLASFLQRILLEHCSQ